MKNFIAGFIMFLLLSSTQGSEAAIHLEKGQTLFEIGSSLNSNVNVDGPISVDIKGESGYKLAIIHAINDNFALQYKLSDFATEEKTFFGLTDSGDAKVQDLNLLYHVTPFVNLIAGYEHSKMHYDKYVASSEKSAFHVGLTAYQPISEKTDLFATYIYGKDVSMAEFGISYDINDHSLFTVSYIHRRLDNVELRSNILQMNTSANYQMSGLAFMYGMKL